MKYRLKSCIFTLLALSPLLANPKTSYANEVALVEKCDAGNMVMCEDLMMHYGANGAGDNPVKWATYAEKACNLNSGGACNNLGVVWSTGKIGTRQIDLRKGNAYYKKACELSHGLGCFNFANMHRLGEGVAVDLKLAFENYGKACELAEAKGCTELGIMYYEGKVAPQNIIMTKTLFEKGCKLGSTQACKNLDILFPRPQ
jgi:TPR repeat protein